MTRSVKISVVIPCFNHGEFLPEAVASVGSVGREDIELIVVDDGSADTQTPLEMDRLAAQGVHVIRQTNKGLAAARNAAISAARGRYIFPLDADDRLRPCWMDRGIQILDSDAKVGVVYGDTQLFGARNALWHAGPFDPHRLLDANIIPCSALYRRAVWEQNCGYDGTMPVQGYEDWDFWVGALERGWEFYYLPETFFEYRQSEQSMLNRTRGYEESVREFIAKKHAVLYRSNYRARLQALQDISVEQLASTLAGRYFDLAALEWRLRGSRWAAMKYLAASVRTGKMRLPGRFIDWAAILVYGFFGIKGFRWWRHGRVQ